MSYVLDRSQQVWGWEEIARLVGRSVNWCRDRAHRADDPLPVNRFAPDGNARALVYADLGAVSSWLARNKIPLQRNATKCSEVQ